MTILVVADTHGRSDLLQLAVERVKPDVLFFLGDGTRDLDVLPPTLPFYAVRGNCDFFMGESFPLTLKTEWGTHCFFLTHGHRYSVKSTLDMLIAAGNEAGADVLLYGHTHRAFEKHLAAGTEVGNITLKKEMLILCPGSLGASPDGVPSFATLTLRDGQILAGFGTL